MKQNDPKPTALGTVVKAFTDVLRSLFFSDDSRDFRRLKNFIAS